MPFIDIDCRWATLLSKTLQGFPFCGIHVFSYIPLLSCYNLCFTWEGAVSVCAVKRQGTGSSFPRTVSFSPSCKC